MMPECAGFWWTPASSHLKAEPFLRPASELSRISQAPFQAELIPNSLFNEQCVFFFIWMSWHVRRQGLRRRLSWSGMGEVTWPELQDDIHPCHHLWEFCFALSHLRIHRDVSNLTLRRRSPRPYSPGCCQVNQPGYYNHFVHFWFTFFLNKSAQLTHL